jgi:opacity protein-like surface antigen
MLKKAILALSLAGLCGSFTSAQTTTSGDYKKAEFYVGYSNGQVDTGIDSGNTAVDFFRDRENFNGFNVSGVYNLNRYLGVKGDFSATYNGKEFSGSFDNAGAPFTVGFKNDNSLYNILGGVQIKDNAKSGTFKPFAHALVGVGIARSKIEDFTCTPTANCPVTTLPDDSFSESGFAGAFGGGIDFRLNDKVQIRAIQLDYNPVRIEGSTQNNVRIGAGIVF